MNVYNQENKYLKNDLEKASNLFDEIEKLASKNVLITGGTGLIGSFYAKELLYINDKFNLNITVTITYRDVDKLDLKFKNYLNKSNFNAIYWDASQEFKSDSSYDIIYHTVNITSSKSYIEKPVETILTTLEGTKHILEFCKNKNIASLIYLSSMEIYGVVDNETKLTTEDSYGYIDILNTRSSYPLSKQVTENLCIAYFKQYGVPIKIMRLAQTFGAGIDWNENRVFAQFSKSVINNSNITLHTDGTSRGNYISIVDSFIASLYIIFYAKSGEVFNVVNENNFKSIKDMASMVINLFPEKKLSIIYDIPKSNFVHGYAPKTLLRLSSSKLCNLGWKPVKELKEMYLDTINYLIEERNKRNEN